MEHIAVVNPGGRGQEGLPPTILSLYFVNQKLNFVTTTALVFKRSKLKSLYLFHLFLRNVVT